MADDKSKKTIPEQINIMKAAEAGAPIIVKAYDARRWSDVNKPAFNWGTSDYKVALDYTDLFGSAVASINYEELYNTLYCLERGRKLGNSIDYSIDILEDSKTKIANNVNLKFNEEYNAIHSDIVPDTIKDTQVYKIVLNSLRDKYYRVAEEDIENDTSILSEYGSLNAYFDNVYAPKVTAEMAKLVGDLNTTLKSLTNDSAIQSLVNISNDTIDDIILQQKSTPETDLYENKADSIDKLKQRMSSVMTNAVEKYNNMVDDTYAVSYDDDIRVTIKKQLNEPEPAISINYSLFNYALNGDENPQMDWGFNDEGKVVTVTGITSSEAQNLVNTFYTQFINELKKEEAARKQSDTSIINRVSQTEATLSSRVDSFIDGAEKELDAFEARIESDLDDLKQNGVFNNLSATNPIHGSLIGDSVTVNKETVNGNISTKTLSASDSISATNKVSAKDISASNNISGETISATDTITATNKVSAKDISASNNISGETISATDTITATNKVSTDKLSANDISTTNIVATNDIAAKTLETSGGISTTGNLSANNISASSYFKSLTVPLLTESVSYVLFLGPILEVESTATNSKYNWDISGKVTFVRASGHNVGQIEFIAGHGYSHSWKTYIGLHKVEAHGVSFMPVTFIYNGTTWLGIKVYLSNSNYSAGITIDYVQGDPGSSSLTMLGYSGSYQGTTVKVSEIIDSIAKVPDQWIVPITFEKIATEKISVSNSISTNNLSVTEDISTKNLSASNSISGVSVTASDTVSGKNVEASLSIYTPGNIAADGELSSKSIKSGPITCSDISSDGTITAKCGQLKKFYTEGIDEKFYNLLDLIYPVGAIFMSASDVNPGLYLGGTWVKIAPGRVLVGAGNYFEDQSGLKVYTPGIEGGERLHKLTVDELPVHKHGYRDTIWTENTDNYGNADGLIEYNKKMPGSGKGLDYDNKKSVYINRTTETSGGNHSHNNMPPFLVVNIWQRVIANFDTLADSQITSVGNIVFTAPESSLYDIGVYDKVIPAAYGSISSDSIASVTIGSDIVINGVDTDNKWTKWQGYISKGTSIIIEAKKRSTDVQNINLKYYIHYNLS